MKHYPGFGGLEEYYDQSILLQQVFDLQEGSEVAG